MTDAATPLQILQAHSLPSAVQAEIERVRLQASMERARALYIEMGNGRGLRKRDSDV